MRLRELVNFFEREFDDRWLMYTRTTTRLGVADWTPASRIVAVESALYCTSSFERAVVCRK
jgi:hypothetical protein